MGIDWISVIFDDTISFVKLFLLLVLRRLRDLWTRSHDALEMCWLQSFKLDIGLTMFWLSLGFLLGCLLP